MFLIQIAATAVVVHILAKRQLQIWMAQVSFAALSGTPLQSPELPRTTALLIPVSYWTAVVAGLAGIWSL